MRYALNKGVLLVARVKTRLFSDRLIVFPHIRVTKEEMAIKCCELAPINGRICCRGQEVNSSDG